MLMNTSRAVMLLILDFRFTLMHVTTEYLGHRTTEQKTIQYSPMLPSCTLNPLSTYSILLT